MVSAGVCDLGDLEAVIQLEGGGGEVFERGEGYGCGGGEVIDGGVKVGVDDVASDCNCGLAGRPGAGVRADKARTGRKRSAKKAGQEVHAG